MKSFAKLYETERGQILALRTQNDDGNPAVEFMFNPENESFGLCSFSVCFEDTDDGFDKRDKAFDTLAEDGVRNVIFSQMDAIDRQFGGAA